MAYTNGHRPWSVYQKVFLQFHGWCQEVARGRRRIRVKFKLVTVDASAIDLSAGLLAWAKFRLAKGGQTAPALGLQWPLNELRGHHRRPAARGHGSPNLAEGVEGISFVEQMGAIPPGGMVEAMVPLTAK